LTAYVTDEFGVPLKVTVADPFGQIVVFPDIVTVGSWITVMVTDPDCGCVHEDVPLVVTLTKLYTVVVV
jgi:hypothetical protein